MLIDSESKSWKGHLIGHLIQPPTCRRNPQQVFVESLLEDY